MHRNRILMWTSFAVGVLCLFCGLLLAAYPWYYLQRQAGTGAPLPKPAELAAGVASKGSPMRLAVGLIAAGLTSLVVAFLFSLLARRPGTHSDAHRRTLAR